MVSARAGWESFCGLQSSCVYKEAAIPRPQSSSPTLQRTKTKTKTKAKAKAKARAKVRTKAKTKVRTSHSCTSTTVHRSLLSYLDISVLLSQYSRLYHFKMPKQPRSVRFSARTIIHDHLSMPRPVHRASSPVPPTFFLSQAFEEVLRNPEAHEDDMRDLEAWGIANSRPDRIQSPTVPRRLRTLQESLAEPETRNDVLRHLAEMEPGLSPPHCVDSTRLTTRTQEDSPPPPYSTCLLYTSPSPRDGLLSRMPSSA